MVSKQAFEQALDVLHRNRASLQLTAEVDPVALREVAIEIAEQTGLATEVALRVVEDELGVKPLPPMPIRKGVTVLDMPRFLPRTPAPAAPESSEQ